MTISSISLIGTTSSGKSTIGNLLCGRYILPTGVQETTTLVIELAHNTNADKTTILTLTDEQGVRIYNQYLQPKDAEIRTHLQRNMEDA